MEETELELLDMLLDRIDVLEAESERLLAQRDALLEALHEIAVATEDAETHLTIWVADKAEAAIAKVRRGVRDE